MFPWLIAFISEPAVQVASFVLGAVPGAQAVARMFKRKEIIKPEYKTVKLTFYGWRDNDPPSAQIAFPVLHKEAGGTGTYIDPVTCAADPRQIEKGTVLYVPRFEKYFIMEDSCGAAVAQDRHLPPIVDLWIGGTAHSNVGRLTTWEWKYTRDEPEAVIINPSPTLAVNTIPLFKD